MLEKTNNFVRLTELLSLQRCMIAARVMDNMPARVLARLRLLYSHIYEFARGEHCLAHSQNISLTHGIIQQPTNVVQIMMGPRRYT